MPAARATAEAHDEIEKNQSFADPVNFYPNTKDCRRILQRLQLARPKSTFLLVSCRCLFPIDGIGRPLSNGVAMNFRLPKRRMLFFLNPTNQILNLLSIAQIQNFIHGKVVACIVP